MKRFFVIIFFIQIEILFAQNFTDGFNFYLPPDDTTTQEFLPAFPIVPIAENFVTIDANGFFSVNGKRIRFFGTNSVTEGAFPTKAKAWFIAGRLRKMGFNLVRFHHMDNGWSSESLFEWGSDTRHLNTVTLDRFENYVAFLKENGIYVNINLHVSRTVKEQDGVADADSILDFGKGVSYFDPKFLGLHKEYAEQLLTHVNPYTGKQLVNDPVMAMVEITNENSLYRMWRSSQLKHFTSGGNLTKRHDQMLTEQWNDFLVEKYSNTQSLKLAWDVGIRPPGAGDQIRDGGFENEAITRNWILEQHDVAKATMEIDETNPYEGSRCARVDVTSVSGTGWHIQWKQINLSIKEDSLYTVQFSGRAEKELPISVAIQKDADPWTVYYTAPFQLSNIWQVFQFSFRASASVTNQIRLSFSLGENTGSYWFDSIKMGVSGINGLDEDESLENRTVRRIDYSECVNYSDQRVMDMSEFYFVTQANYFDEMVDFLKNELGVKVPIVGTNWNVGPGDLMIQSKLDYIDNHSYWDHPQFPNISWDSYDWLINNTPMVTDENGGTIARLMAGVPVAGKPFTISEYNHPFPNRYQSEGILFLTSYASFHNADGFMFFDYCGSVDNWETDKVDGYFSQHRNTAMMALMPSCAKAFREGMIKPADQTILLNFSEKNMLGLPKKDDRFWAGPTLYPQKIALQHAIRNLSFSSSTDFDPSQLPAEPTNPYTSDTGEIVWDTNGLLQVQSDRFVAATGFLSDFKNTKIGPLTLLNAGDFGSFTWISLTSSPLHHAEKSLFTISTKLQNTNMKWDGLSTVHNSWGSAPTEMFPISVTVALFIKADSIHVYPLNEIGQENGQTFSYTPIAPDVFEVTFDQAKDKTVWYGLRKFGVGTNVKDSKSSLNTFSLCQNYPNPFNSATTIEFSLDQSQPIQLKIYNINGQKVKTLVDDKLSAGLHKVEWDGLNNQGLPMPSGLYLYKLYAKNFVSLKKMVLMR